MTKMLRCFQYLKCKTDLLYDIYTILKNILTYFETAIPTWCYSSTYPKDTLANYVS